MSPSPKVKITMAWPADLHAATANLAVRNRRSFTAEACVALDEHLAAAGIAMAATPITPTPTPTPSEEMR